MCECPVFWWTVWSGAMAEFWLISAPGEKTCQQTWDRMNAATSHANNLSTNNKFTIPDLKVKWSWFSVLPMLQRCLMSSCPKTYIVGWLLSHKLSVVCVILPYDVLAPRSGWDRLQVGWMKGWSLQSAIYRAKLVSFQVGTLDVLVGLSDELAKLDSFVERFDFYLQLLKKKKKSIHKISLYDNRIVIFIHLVWWRK